MQTTGSAAGVPEAVPVAGIYSLGDSITAGAQLADPSQAYPFLLAAHYDRPVHDLAAGGATAVATAKDQLPLVSEPCWLGTLNVGTNDAAFMVLGSETQAQFAENLQTIVHTLQQKCTRVVVMTAIENANSQTERFGPQDAVEHAAVNADILALSGVTVLDLNRDARLHDPAYSCNPETFTRIKPARPRLWKTFKRSSETAKALHSPQRRRL